ncbi:acyltransferase family protein [Clostridium chromiireducens]|uniref:acyltransferase family protein n=1 Tax=Clostridium chromiireducens TaxID=225345 RepID=UPI003AF5A423
MRKYYIDNIRILCILMLFPFHTAMIFNGWGENWYVHSKALFGATMLDLAVYPWWMSGLFTLAGVSTVYSLRNRTVKQYIQERFLKLFIPLISSILLVIPVQAYIADRYFNNYIGSYIEHFAVYFSLTDWSGYDGHFTPGQTWFILYLFVISMITLPLIIWYKNKENKISGKSITIMKIVLMFLIILLAAPILDIGGKSIGEFAADFLLGYFILSMEEVQARLEKYRIPLGLAWVILIIMRCTMYQMSISHGLLWEVQQRVLGWIGILAIMGLGKKFLEFNNKFTQCFTSAIFPIYIFHQSIIVIVGFIVVQTVRVPVIQYFVIMGTSFILTIIMYEIFRRLPVIRFLFGIKKDRRNKLKRTINKSNGKLKC